MKSLITFLLLFLAALTTAQGWQQTFEGLLNPAGLCQTPDGGVALLANSIPGGPLGRQIVLSKTDQDGRTQWQKAFGGTGDDEGRALLLTAEGNLVVAGKISYLANNGDALLAMFNLSGQKLWERNYNFGILDEAKAICQLPDQGYILAVEADNQLRLLKTDSVGIEVWSKAIPQTNGLSVKYLALRADGGFVVTLLRNNLPIGAPAAVVLQINALGDVEFQATLPHFSNFVTTDQVRCKPASDSTYWLMHRDSVYLLDQDTTVLKKWKIESPFDLYLTDLIPDTEGGFFALGTNYSFSGIAFSRAVFVHFNANGTEIWRRYYAAPNFLHSSWAAVQTQDSGFLLSGNYAKNGSYFSYLVRTDTLGQAFTNQIKGRVFWDKNLNCLPNPTEPALAGWLLRIERPNGDFHYASTDASGNYQFEAGIGEHKVRVLSPNGIWYPECLPEAFITFDQPFQSEIVDFPVLGGISCPLPRVDAGIDYWIHCAENKFVVRYSNAGTATADHASITLSLDSLLTLTGASIPYSQIAPHAWNFALGDLPALTDSSFWVSVQTDCDPETLERTLCIKAAITPDEPCLSPLTGPLLILEGRCDGDSVRFILRNIGLPMPESQPYIVVEDDVMLLQGLAIQLGAGEEFVLSLPANGSTWRFEVLQSQGTPDWLSDPHVAAVVEGCSTSGAFSTGYVNQFSLYDGGYFSETECRPVIANASGLEKAAYPIGLSDEHLIPANTDLEYELHYQNTTGDSVLVLSLRDTLDHTLLNPASVVPGPGSHPYQFDLTGAGVLNFRFMGLALADSAHAWVKFRISQQPDLPVGTVIRNSAWAYPDFSTPLPTNETYHVIGAPLLVETHLPPAPIDQAFKVWPVPSTSGLNIELNQVGNYTLQLNELTGRLVLEKKFSGNALVLSDQEFPSGMFFATIFKGNLRIGTVPVFKYNP